jgi:hypothetical protein
MAPDGILRRPSNRSSTDDMEGARRDWLDPLELRRLSFSLGPVLAAVSVMHGNVGGSPVHAYAISSISSVVYAWGSISWLVFCQERKQNPSRLGSGFGCRIDDRPTDDGGISMQGGVVAAVIFQFSGFSNSSRLAAG